MSKLVWRVKLVAELEPGVTTETEVACLERGEEAGLADLGLRLNEAKQLTAALQAEMVSAQVAAVGERSSLVRACGRVRWPAKATTVRRSAPCSATCRSGSGGCSSAPATARASRRASLPSISARVLPRNWPM